MNEELIKRLRVSAEALDVFNEMGAFVPKLPILTEAADTIEAQAAEIKRLREALRGMIEYSRYNERWQDAHPEYVKNSIRALGETE